MEEGGDKGVGAAVGVFGGEEGGGGGVGGHGRRQGKVTGRRSSGVSAH